MRQNEVGKHVSEISTSQHSSNGLKVTFEIANYTSLITELHDNTLTGLHAVLALFSQSLP